MPAGRIRKDALGLGFDAVGIADAAATPEPEATRLRSWLARGMHGEMGYMQSRADERADPARIVPGIRSIIVVAAGYLADVWAPPHAERGGVSRYAWGRDYHRFFRNRLRKLRKRVERALPGAAAYATVDTGPVMEKAWAQRAGLGWLGKHGNVITRDFASFAFLGVVLVDRELATDRPAVDRCGSCTRCIEHCPTGAIVAPYVVDARRCISYLTIELRGPIPSSLRRDVGKRLFGCDDCQECCPWNRLARTSELADWKPQLAWAPSAPDPVEIASLSRETWDQLTRGTALRRAGYDGLRRNALIVVGNDARPIRERAVLVARALLEDASPVVRGAAAWALGEIGSEAARSALAEADATESDSGVREEIREAISRTLR